MDNKLYWLPRYWIELFNKRNDPKVKVFIANEPDLKVVKAMKMGAKYLKSKSIRKIKSGYIYNTYLINFGK